MGRARDSSGHVAGPSRRHDVAGGRGMGDRRRQWRWVRRYAPAEVAATAGALLGALVGARLAGPVGAAVGGDLGEGLAFWAVIVIRELLAERSATRPRTTNRLFADLLREFGPAEALDSFALRPLAMLSLIHI